MPHLPPSMSPDHIVVVDAHPSSLCGQSYDLLTMGASESWWMIEMTMDAGDFLVHCSWRRKEITVK